LLSTSTVLNILHETGQALIEAQHRRAKAVYEEISAAKCFIIDPSKPWRKREPILSDELSDSDYEGGIGERVMWHWEAGKLTMNDRQRNEAEGLIVIQVDECVVKSQSKSPGKDVWVFTGVVNANGRAYYFTAEDAANLFYQIG
jgi:hypothetical protein